MQPDQKRKLDEVTSHIDNLLREVDEKAKNGQKILHCNMVREENLAPKTLRVTICFEVG